MPWIATIGGIVHVAVAVAVVAAAVVVVAIVGADGHMKPLLEKLE